MSCGSTLKVSDQSKSSFSQNYKLQTWWRPGCRIYGCFWNQDTKTHKQEAEGSYGNRLPDHLKEEMQHLVTSTGSRLQGVIDLSKSISSIFCVTLHASIFTHFRHPLTFSVDSLSSPALSPRSNYHTHWPLHTQLLVCMCHCTASRNAEIILWNWAEGLSCSGVYNTVGDSLSTIWSRLILSH